MSVAPIRHHFAPITPPNLLRLDGDTTELIPIAVAIARLALPAVDGDEPMTVQPPCFLKDDHRTQDLREGLHIVLAKVRTRLDVGMSCPEEPEPLDIPMRGLLQAAAGTDTRLEP